MIARRLFRIHRRGAPIRCSSSSLKDRKEDDGAKKELLVPKSKWDPVPQKFLKLLTVEHHGVGPANFDDYTIWYPIYKFPHLKKVYAFIRIKAYATFISSAICLGRLVDSVLSASFTLSTTTLLAGLTLTGMGIAGNLCRKLIVHIYTTEDLKYVRLSRYTFFGKRRDIVLPSSILVPLSDSNDTHRKLTLKLEVNKPNEVDLSYDNYEFYDEPFEIVLVFGGIHDEEKFEKILGKLLKRVY